MLVTLSNLPQSPLLPVGLGHLSPPSLVTQPKCPLSAVIVCGLPFSYNKAGQQY